MPKPSDIKPGISAIKGKGINMCLYGEIGTGKTPVVGTSQKALVLDADKGFESAVIHVGSTADIWEVDGWDDMDEAYEYLQHEGHREYRWVWLDGASLWFARGLHDIMRDLVLVKTHRKVWAPDKGEYQQNMVRLNDWVRHMVELPIHFGITAHVQEYEKPTGETVFMPEIQGRNMPSKICGWLGLVGYFRPVVQKGKVYRVMHVQNYGKYYAKDRYNIGGDKGRIVNPTIPMIERRVKESIQRARGKGN